MANDFTKGDRVVVIGATMRDDMRGTVVRVGDDYVLVEYADGERVRRPHLHVTKIGQVATAADRSEDAAIAKAEGAAR